MSKNPKASMSKAPPASSGGGKLRTPLGQVTREIDAPAKLQKANSSLSLPTAKNAIQVAPKKKKPMHKAIADQMMAGY